MEELKCPKCNWRNKADVDKCKNCGYSLTGDGGYGALSDEEIDSQLDEVKIFATPVLDNNKIDKYLGVVSYEVIFGSNVLKDIFAGFSDLIGGRSSVYENTFRDAKQVAVQNIKKQCAELGGNAIINFRVDYLTISDYKMLMCYVSGEAVVLS